MKVNRDKFFAGYRKAFGRLTADEAAGLKELLGFIESDGAWDDSLVDIQQVSYLLATILHECARKWKPIREYASGEAYERRADLGNNQRGDGKRFKGRGYVQITGRRNYANFSRITGSDLVDKPDDALIPEISYEIASVGMRQGLFTGKKLDDYINENGCDYRRARRIINALDRADLIAGYAKKFEVILEDALAPSEPQEDNNIQKPVADDLSSLVAQSEQPTTTSVSVTESGVKVETSEGAKPEEKIAIEKPVAQNFAATMRNKIGAMTGGNLTLQVVRDYAEQARLFGLSARFWMWVSIIALIGAGVYLLSAFYKHKSDVRRDMEITDKLIAANSTPSNRVELVEKEKIPELKAKGYRIIER